MRKFMAAAAMLALLVPGIGQAETLTYSAPYDGIHQGGDAVNYISGSKDTGSLQIVRIAAGSPSGSLGCVGRGGYIELEQTVGGAGDAIATIEADYSDALVGPFGFVKVAVRKDGKPLQALVVRGPIYEAGTLSLTLTDLAGNPSPVEGPLEIWFGVEVSSSCPPSPPIEIARATFTELRAITS
ncbi:MAG: hypothetical protein ACLGH3_02740 [Actinomycetota bacterium]